MTDRFDKGAEAAERIREALENEKNPDWEDVHEVVDLVLGDNRDELVWDDEKGWVPR